jgi:NAD(P)-dependent dehydrogenase (short-subunit alcohol dehydrogenase family)
MVERRSGSKRVSLTDKIVVITGAASGIGRATAELAASRGAICHLSDIGLADVEAVAEGIRASGGQAFAFACDVTSHEQITAFVDDVLGAAGRIDALVNNAGVIRMESLFEITPQSWKRVFDVNVSGVFFMLQAVAKTMVDRGISGRIVNIASEAGRRGSELCAHYGASKTAVISITRSAALALTRHGILVNAVAPGLIQTAMWDSIDEQLTERGDFGPGEIKRVGIAATPIGRAAAPLEVAACVCFLLSDDARYVAGHTLDVNGGRFMS